MKIDIVYLWVDSNDNKWRTEKNKWQKRLNKHNNISSESTCKARWRDNNELLYSLRSVDKFAPWVNHIFIVTGFNHIPKWLNTKHNKISIIPHEQIMPPRALPTFNSNSIEMCIPNIPGLSEHFLLMNDDMFFNKQLSPSYFYDTRGRAKIMYSTHHGRSKNIQTWKSRVNQYSQTLIISAQQIKNIFGNDVYKYRPAHGIDPYIKSSWQECASNPTISKLISSQITNKFRTNNELQRWIFNLYDLITNRAIFIHSRAKKYPCNKIKNIIYNTIFTKQIKQSPIVCTDTTIAQSALSNAPIFCINDSPDNTNKILRNNANYMRNRFPDKSSFEI